MGKSKQIYHAAPNSHYQNHMPSQPAVISLPLPHLAEKVVLVTGAGQGLGKAVAIDCAQQGATVILLGRTIPKLEATYDAILAAGCPQPAIVSLDFSVATSEDLAGLAYTIQTEFNRLDAIIHCAAHLSALGPFQQQTLEEWLLALKVNLAIPVALTRACFPLLNSAASGAKVIFTLDDHFSKPSAYWGAYGVTKSALFSLLQVLTDEWTQHPYLNVAAIVPGPISSPLRLKTHPAENLANLVSPKDIAPLYTELLQQHQKNATPSVYWAQDWYRSKQGLPPTPPTDKSTQLP